MFGGRGMGGGRGSTGGNFLRTVGKAVTGARVSGSGGGGTFSSSINTITRPSSPTSNAAQKLNSSNYLSLSSSQFSSHNQGPVPPGHGRNQFYDEFEWVSEDGTEHEYEYEYEYENESVGWNVPSFDEVQGTVSALHHVFGPLPYAQLPKDDGSPDRDILGRVVKPIDSVHRIARSGLDGDWIEPSLELQLGDPRILQVQGVERVYDAFHLLETDPLIQKMVMAISSDRVIWDAIQNNETVQQLRKSFYEDKDDDVPQNSEDSTRNVPSNESKNIVHWIFNNTKMKAMEVIERMTELVNYLFDICNNGGEKNKGGGGMDPFEEKLRTSFFISIVVLLVVVLSRTSKAASQ